MDTFARIIQDLGGPTAVARALGKGDNAVDKWVRRNSIHSRHWSDLIRLAAEQGRADITPERLTKLATKVSAEPSRKRTRKAA